MAIKGNGASPAYGKGRIWGVGLGRNSGGMKVESGLLKQSCRKGRREGEVRTL